MKTSVKIALLFALPTLTMTLSAWNAPNRSANVSHAYSHVLSVLNVEDYIYINDPDYGYDEDDLVIQFEDYIKENYPQYSDVKVVYDTTDTPETMYNKLKTGKSQYDIICPSDYMIQKMLSEDMLEKIDREKVPNYVDYASPTISQYIDSIEAANGEIVGDYTVGYMWGTLGILFNPTYQLINNRGMEPEDVIDAMQSWSALWNKTFNGVTSIKDSVRDTLCVVTLNHFDEELTALRGQYVEGEITAEEYKNQLDTYFNIFSSKKWDDELQTLRNELYQEMLTLKSNIFGLEVDNGKLDIVTGKIGVNLAWSGDAVYAMSLAADPDETNGNPFDLYYSVPENGSNIWFDGWVMPKNRNRNPDQTELAHLFLDFLSNPEIAAKNMDYTGYTSFIGGNDIRDLVRDWYDIRTDEIYYDVYDENDELLYEGASVYYLDTNENEYVEVGYNDFLKESHDSSLDEMLLFADISEEEEPDYQPVYLLDENDELTDIQKTYGDLTIVNDDSELQEVSLEYFFKDTLEAEEGEEIEESDYLFYSDSYYVGDEDNISVGGDFFCQYPDEETINRCCIMKDFGDNNAKIIQLWEDFKVGELPNWAIIILSIEVGAMVAVAIYLFARKRIAKALRTQRKQIKQD